MTPNIPRLTRLVHVLEALPETSGFDISLYISEQHACGTVACACGWGALDPVLMSEGLRAQATSPDFSEDDEEGEQILVESVSDMSRMAGWHFEVVQVKDGEVIGDESDFFGLSFDRWAELFTSDGYEHLGRPTQARDVATSIREMFGISA